MTQPQLTAPGPQYPIFSPIIVPELSSLALTEDERQLIERLQARAWYSRGWMMLTDAYYKGEQIVTNLGISIPAELAGLRTVIGWPALAIDPLDERLSGEGFRLKDATDSDMDLYEIWQANHLDAEQSLAHVDAMAMGRAFLTIGSPEEPGDPPEICVESPLNISALWDTKSRKPTAVLQTYWVDFQRHAALYLPDQTISLAQNDSNEWEITNRDQHHFGMVPVVRMTNRPRSNRRDGSSEITPAMMSITDATCRTLLGLEIAREFYSVPQKYILGATEADFQDKDGNPKSVWQTYISHIMGLERDDDGNLPTVGQFTAMDPSTFTKIIDMYASKFAGMIGAPPQDLGLYTEGNPASADAIRSSEARRDRKAKRKQQLFGYAWVEAMQMAIRFRDGGDLAEEFKHMEMDWADPATPTPAATTDALQKQVAAGIIPPTSDVVLKHAGYSAIERARLEADRKLDAGAAILAELANSLQAKQARTDLAVSGDIIKGQQPVTVNPAPTGTQPKPPSDRTSPAK